MRFVIQKHTTHNKHYDLMIEVSDTLLTWQIPLKEFRRFISSGEISVQKIQDHRKKYLTYEGPVSCDRGRVDIFDSGDYRGTIKNHEDLTVMISGNRLRGILSLNKQSDALYRLKYTPDHSQKCRG